MHQPYKPAPRAVGATELQSSPDLDIRSCRCQGAASVSAAGDGRLWEQVGSA